MSSPLLEVSVQEKHFGDQPVLLDVRFHVDAGEIVSIVGASGCGKSTLLRIACGLDSDYRGEVRVQGAAPDLHSHTVGLIFQEPRLLPWLTVADNVAFGRGRGRHPRAQQLLAEVGLQGYAAAYPKELSGGMAQRVAIARGLFTQPTLLLLDEPFSAVDALTRMRLQDLLLSVAFRHDITLLLITHDITEAAYLSDRIIALTSRPGRVHGIIDVDVPRARERRSPALANVEARALGYLHEDAGAASSAGAHASG